MELLMKSERYHRGFLKHLEIDQNTLNIRKKQFFYQKVLFYFQNWSRPFHYFQYSGSINIAQWKMVAVINIEGSLEGWLHPKLSGGVHHELSKMQAHNWARALPVGASCATRLDCARTAPGLSRASHQGLLWHQGTPGSSHSSCTSLSFHCSYYSTIHGAEEAEQVSLVSD